jgi:exonuclease III
MIFHQNIRGISNKIEELLHSLSPNTPQVICLTEHHLRIEEIINVNLGQYTLGAKLYRQTYSHGGVCIYVPINIQFSVINFDQYCKEKDMEVFALKLYISSHSFTIICIYRSRIGNFTYFLNQLESVLNQIYNSSTGVILCGDFNIDYLDDNYRKHLLDSLLASFGLYSTLKFPTRISNTTVSLIDNIYINIYKHDFFVVPPINGLLDHDGQIISLSNIFITAPKYGTAIRRKIADNSVNLNFY